MIKDYQILIGLIIIAIAVYNGLKNQPIAKTEFETCFETTMRSTTLNPNQATLLCSSAER